MFSLFESPTYWTVSRLTTYLQQLIAEEDPLRNLWVVGEVSNASRSTSGHFYFTLKDANASLRCVMWRQQVAYQLFLPQNGDLIVAHGYLDLYPPAGVYQLYADNLISLGAGALYQEFLQRKAKLEQEGLFDPQRKKPIPTFPRKIGIVTSEKAAALQDMLNTLKRRYPLAEVIIAPASVQGEDAVPTLIRALRLLDREIKPDVILLARGGGSIEDLWAFNDEALVRAIAELNTPVVTGIGHETDFTLADFASDLRAPTPTAAAELVTPNLADLQANLLNQSQRLQNAAFRRLDTYRAHFNQLTHRLKLSSPLNRLNVARQRLDEWSRRLEINVVHDIRERHAKTEIFLHRLEALDPLTLLSRGYAILTKEDGEIIRSIRQARLGESIQARLRDGQFYTRVEGISQEVSL
ncbi:MAG: exodeoxyribonuclease VII large subunit [Anaerolineales bacterium]|nr:exodeoxyribonuclease VII large subunit [Anaerolineales bacterium]MDW8447764.1 exodeoxyribonuclease VII large subunit [Anaerolineales bacterium]